jgi:hypothetical protein
VQTPPFGDWRLVGECHGAVLPPVASHGRWAARTVGRSDGGPLGRWAARTVGGSDGGRLGRWAARTVGGSDGGRLGRDIPPGDLRAAVQPVVEVNG